MGHHAIWTDYDSLWRAIQSFYTGKIRHENIKWKRVLMKISFKKTVVVIGDADKPVAA